MPAGPHSMYEHTCEPAIMHHGTTLAGGCVLVSSERLQSGARPGKEEWSVWDGAAWHLLCWLQFQQLCRGTEPLLMA